MRVLAIYLLSVVIVASTHFTVVLQQVLQGQLIADTMLTSLLLAIIEQSGLLLAISYFLGQFFALRQLYARNEMDVVFNFGVSEGRLFFWLIPPTLLFSLIVGLLVFYITPFSAAQLNSLYGTQVLHKIERISDKGTEFSRDLTLRAHAPYFQLLKVEDALIEVVEGKLNKKPQVENSQVVLQLQDGYLLQWRREDFSQIRFRSGQFFIPYSLEISSSSAAMTTSALLERGDKGELYQRIAIFLSVPLSLPLALVCSRRRVRASGFMRAFLGIIVYFFYLVVSHCQHRIDSQ